MRAPLLLLALGLAAPRPASAKCVLTQALAAANQCDANPSRACLTQLHQMRLDCQAEADSQPISAPSEAPVHTIALNPEYQTDANGHVVFGPDGKPVMLPAKTYTDPNPPPATNDAAAVSVGSAIPGIVVRRLTASETKLTPIVEKLEAQQKAQQPEEKPGDAPPIPKDKRGEVGRNAAASGDFKTANNAAQQALADGDHGTAGDILNTILKNKPGDPTALGLRSSIAAQKGDFAGALADARAALKSDPNNALASELAAFAESKLRPIGDKPKPKLDFETHAGESALSGGVRAAGSVAGQTGSSSASSKNPGIAFTQVGGPAEEAMERARRYAALGDYARAQGEIEHALELNAKNAAALALRARFGNRKGDFAGAIRDADAALSLDPKNVPALLERGYALYGFGKYKEALSDVEQALSLDPLNAMGHLYHAMILEKMERAQEAIAEYIKAAELDASLKPIVDEALARLGFSPATAAGRAARRYWPVWGGAAALALLLLAFGFKRVIKPEWATPMTPGTPLR